ncbi:MAG: hypothetical protein ACYDA8_11440 [Deferrisomatales bacterium]
MSEYQYYEFQAIDRPLTEEERKELRSYSSRARITSTSFAVDYSWGHFKGNADAWMEKHFDAFLRLANWGTRDLKLGLPAAALPLDTAQAYAAGDGLRVRERGAKVILSFNSDEEGGGEWVEGEGELASLLPVRDELARGDLRALYLGWLLGAGSGELDGEATEPPVPPGLGQLSEALRALANFLRVDRDLVAVAARASAALEAVAPRPEEVAAWVAGLPAGEKDRVLCASLLAADPRPVAELRRRFLREREGTAGAAAAPVRRTVGELLAAAEAYAQERRRREAAERAREEARREQQAAAARARHLDGLAGREPKLWAEVEALVATKQPRSYDRAVEILVDLRDLAARKKGGDFLLRVTALRQAHERKPSFLERLRKAGV